MRKIKSPITGADIVINAASFKDAMALKNAITGCLSKAGIDFSGLNLDDIFESDMSIIINPILAVDSDEKVNDAISNCMIRCTYNSMKIDANTFEDEKARKDYYLIVIEVLKENLSPFLSSLPFKSLQSMKKPEGQKNIPT